MKAQQKKAGCPPAKIKRTRLRKELGLKKRSNNLVKVKRISESPRRKLVATMDEAKAQVSRSLAEVEAKLIKLEAELIEHGA